MIPTEIKLHRRSRVLEIAFDDGQRFDLPCELLRVHSPSAEVQGHGEWVVPTGKEAVNITRIEPVGQYAVRLTFDDGHNTGLYTWDYLYDLGAHRERYWAKYLAALEKLGYARTPAAAA